MCVCVCVCVYSIYVCVCRMCVYLDTVLYCTQSSVGFVNDDDDEMILSTHLFFMTETRR